MEERKMKPRPRKSRRKVCGFCVDKVEHIDYKDTARLRKYVSERGKIMPRRMSGVCSKASARAGHRHQARPHRCPSALRSRLIKQRPFNSEER